MKFNIFKKHKEYSKTSWKTSWNDIRKIRPPKSATYFVCAKLGGQWIAGSCYYDAKGDSWSDRYNLISGMKLRYWMLIPDIPESCGL
jgi:hypothetical protein